MTGAIETVRSVVRQDQCDHFGHLNIQHYSGALSDGFMVLMSMIGLGHEAVKAHQIGVVALTKNMRFRRELRPGDHYMVETGFVVAEAERLHIGHRMTRLTDGKLALTGDTMCVPLDLQLRRKTTMPADIVTAARAYITRPEVFEL